MGLIKNYSTIAGWYQARFLIDGKPLVGITELKYETEQETEPVYGAGKEPVGIAEGNRKYTASIGLLAEEYTELLKRLPKGMGLTELRDFTIVASYRVQGRKFVDRIHCYSLKKSGREFKQGDKSLPYTFDIEVVRIDENV